MAALSRAYSNVLKKYPYIVQPLQAGLLMGSGDVISQFVIEQKSRQQYKWQRTARFFAIGTCFVGPTLTAWYGFLHKNIGTGSGLRALKKVAVDQMVFAPVFLGCFLVVFGLMDGHSLKAIQDGIKRNYKDIMMANWSVWPAVQICNFYFIPLLHQVLVAQSFALLWNTYLAWKTNQQPAPVEVKIIDN